MRRYEISRTLEYRVDAENEAEAIKIVRETEDSGWNYAQNGQIVGLKEIELIDTTVSTQWRDVVVTAGR